MRLMWNKCTMMTVASINYHHDVFLYKSTLVLFLSLIIMGLSCGPCNIWHTEHTLFSRQEHPCSIPDSLTMLMQIRWAPRMALGECRQTEQVI